jgi:type III pantothenate kinase
MMLGVDVGNTNISFGVFEFHNLIHKFDLKTDRRTTAFEFLSFLESIFSYLKINSHDLKEVKIASVVPEVERVLYELFANIYKKPTKFVKRDDVLLKINLKNPNEVGIDRLLNVISALNYYGSEENILVIDFGTAITFDIGLKTFEYEGGIIFPGINLSLEALKNGTAKLPKVSLKKPTSPVGRSTSEAINAGIFYGYASMVNGCVKEIKSRYNENFNVIVTGGYGEILSSYFDFDFKLDYNLILRGISYL